MTGQTGVFADNALVYTANGLRVFPTGGEDGKRPLIKRWNKVGANAVSELIKKFPDANIGVIDGDFITRVDIDDPKLVQGAIDRFGNTPVHVLTPSGGVHLWYASNGERRVIGLDDLKIDILGRGGFGVAPPSIRPDGMTYDFVRGGPEYIRLLPTIKRGALPEDAFQKGVLPGDQTDVIGRNFTLFERLLRLAPNCETKDELAFQAAPLNESLFKLPMDADEVLKIVGSVWRYKERDKLWAGQEARAVLTTTELIELGGNSDAALILMKLRAAHGWHNGREFPLANALAVSLGWGLRRFHAAKAFLIKCCFLEIIYAGGKGPHDPPKARLLR
jgi:hypothetical protein